MLLIISTIVATVLCAILYRLGGLGDDGAKQYNLPKLLCNTKVRDLGIPTVCVSFMMLFTDFSWWSHVICFVLTFAFLTTYWDSLFGYDNFYFHGFVIGLASLSYMLWWQVSVRAVAVGLIMGFVCDNTENDWIEELTRGAAIGVTLPLLLIGA